MNTPARQATQVCRRFGNFRAVVAAEDKPILLVEDSQDDVFFFKRTLQEAELKNPLHHVLDTDAALEYLAGTGEYSDRAKFPFPSIVLIDLHLPGQDGFQVLEWLGKRPEYRSVLVVVLTGAGSIHEVSKAYRLGANSFLVKPCRPEDLRNLAKGFAAAWGLT